MWNNLKIPFWEHYTPLKEFLYFITFHSKFVSLPCFVFEKQFYSLLTINVWFYFFFCFFHNPFHTTVMLSSRRFPRTPAICRHKGAAFSSITLFSFLKRILELLFYTLSLNIHQNNKKNIYFDFRPLKKYMCLLVRYYN